MIYVYRRPPNQLLSVSRLKHHLLHEVESNKHIMSQWEAARTALLNNGHYGISFKNDPHVFTDDAGGNHGFIFLNDDDHSFLVVASWQIEEYGMPFATY